jgi:hypothetical protein
MFETAADQADGLRRLFSPREPSVIPIGCCAPAASCRGFAAALIGRLGRSGFTPVLFDRLDLAHELGDVQAHAPVDRLLLLDEPVRLARWLKARQSSMLLLLSYRREELPSHYATIKSIVNGPGLRQFATLFVDAPTAAAGAEAHYRLASCARRFLDVEIEPLLRGAHGQAGVTEASLACLQRLETGIRGYSPSDLLMPAVGAGVPQQPARQPRH